MYYLISFLSILSIFFQKKCFLVLVLHLSNKKKMKLVLRILLTSLLVMIISYLMKGVVVDQFTTALTVAVVFGLLNFFVKPVLVLFTLPVTLLTFGLFLLVINAIIILLCDHLVDGFDVNGFWTALFFSVILSLSQSLVFQLTGEGKQ
jgi:putative membrane protein